MKLLQVCDNEVDIVLKKQNNFLQDVSFPNFEIASCEFYNDGKNVFVGSVKKPYFYTYDLETGETMEISKPRSLVF